MEELASLLIKGLSDHLTVKNATCDMQTANHLTGWLFFLRHQNVTTKETTPCAPSWRTKDELPLWCSADCFFGVVGLCVPRSSCYILLQKYFWFAERFGSLAIPNWGNFMLYCNTGNLEQLCVGPCVCCSDVPSKWVSAHRRAWHYGPKYHESVCLNLNAQKQYFWGLSTVATGWSYRGSL